jgi:hypothetical protein
MTQVKLYQDIDACINAEMPQGWGKLKEAKVAVSSGHTALTEGFTFKIRWAPAMIEKLASLDLDLVWTTTWQHDAALGVGPVIGWGEDARYLAPLDGVVSFPTILWKLEAVVHDLEENPGPFVWIDDEIEDYELVKDIIKDYGGLLIAPNAFTGISTKDIEQIEQYLAVLED